MRDVTEAHFLHQRSGLELVIKPLVPHPTALAWVPRREELLATSREGSLHAVDPVMGTRTLMEGLGEVAVLQVHADRRRFLVMNRSGRWLVGNMGGEVLLEGEHPFLGAMDALFAGEAVVLAGDDAQGRSLLLMVGEQLKGRVRLPSRVVPVSVEGGLHLARATHAGLQVMRVAKGARFPEGEQTRHRLQLTGDWVLGVTDTGLCVWPRAGGAPRSMRLPDLTAGDVSADGEWVGLGTRNGAVALAALNRAAARISPHLVKAFDAPVTSVAFSQRGRWLATAGDGLQLWTWEDDEE